MSLATEIAALAQAVGADIKALNLAVPALTTASTLTYAAGVLTGISETVGGITKATTLSYTAGLLTTITEVFGNRTRTQSLTYTAGVLTSTTTSEVYS
jgi:hypothetical protein